MSDLLALAPVATSMILGLVYVMAGDGRPAVKLAGLAVFLAAVYLQFFSRHPLPGLLVQSGLALCLAGWRKANAS